jgi:hypothetical protein
MNRCLVIRYFLVSLIIQLNILISHHPINPPNPINTNKEKPRNLLRGLCYIEFVIVTYPAVEHAPQIG